METFTVVLWFALLAQLVIAAPAMQGHDDDLENSVLNEPIHWGGYYPPLPTCPAGVTTTTTQEPLTNWLGEDYIDAEAHELASSDEPEAEIITIS